ncbi:DNA adenine methylase [Pararobbsia alpina]|uniref:DNA adenine methylase n=1 Tax=Pararobbsia alpina TaxID=621374 RepID=UPI0039A53999
MSGVTRPILRFHGGKFKLADWIISHFPVHRIYVEPYGGAASVLLSKERSYQDVYNDLDGELVNLFRVARDRGPELLHVLELTPYSRDEFRLSYERSEDDLERARRVVVRSFMGHGSNSHNRLTGFRRHSRASGTSPCGDWRNLPEAFAQIIERLRGVVIECRDALGLIAEQDSTDTLFYLDPPYVASTRDKGADYRFELTDNDHRLLACAMRGARGMVAISGYRSDLYDDVFAGWVRSDRLTRADGARARVESLWMNPALTDRLELERAQGRLIA